MRYVVAAFIVAGLSACGGGSGGGIDDDGLSNDNDRPDSATLPEPSVEPIDRCDQPTRLGESKFGASCF